MSSRPSRHSLGRRWPAAVAVALAVSFWTVTAAGPVDGDGPQPSAVIVGDSLTGGNQDFIRTVLTQQGLGSVRLEGLSSRRIAVSFEFLGPRDSGIQRVRTLKAAGVRPALWVVQLGTNDLGVVQNCRCADRVAFAGDLVDRLIDEIGPGVPIAWVTVVDHARPDVAQAFNDALGNRAVRNRWMTLIDWNALAGLRPEWFSDAVHPNMVGVRPFAQMYVDHISALLLDPPGRPWDGVGHAPAMRIRPER